ncbi:nucleotidyl transferase AbiEii/AbiGii toxin family protein [Yersinia similis]|uniref:nucleotidyl transferase AbiEii/AbiGii toxin family protein n=1 Tax=Yersinia similis TaxID=367190 RepID=UPI0011A49FEA|nr:nucleotidyl transferase AbiEii/AbiGii toxin family protein [Yersinia similis]
MEYSIEDWVKEAPQDRLVFRQAVHIVLSAIANSEYLKPKMIMKGGMLLGIRYKSSRFTEDIDFSTKMKLSEIDKGEFESELSDALAISSDQLSYGVVCAIQSASIQPKKGIEKATFPSFNLKIGYARKNSKSELSRLERRECPNTIKIDYSFNELSYDIDDIALTDEEGVCVYGITDLIAEKIRSIIQQPYRNRTRRQDIYDLNYLLDKISLGDDELLTILHSLLGKSNGKIPDGDVNISTLDRDDIKERSKKDYLNLKDEVIGELPDFNSSYDRINDFYKSLPWGVIGEDENG